MDLNKLTREVEDKAVEYLNATRLEALEEMALNQLAKSANNGYIRLHKLECSALINAVRGLHRKRQAANAEINRLNGEDRPAVHDLAEEIITLQDQLQASTAQVSRMRDALKRINEWSNLGGYQRVLHEVQLFAYEALSETSPKES